MNVWSGLGWAVLHFLWQGTLIALVLFIALRTTKAPRLRHGFSVVALLLMPLCFVWTAWRMSGVGPTFVSARAAGIPVSSGAGPQWVMPQTQLAELIPWLSWIWIVGVLVVAIYRLAGYWFTRRLIHQGVCAPPVKWRERLGQLSARMGVSRLVMLLESSLVDVPVVVGWLRPVLLMPVGMLAGMPASQLDTILLHELAHVYRRDALVNLMQMAVESLLFHHPAVWWVSSVIRQEREKCCDDLVVNLQGNPNDYVAALLAMEDHRSRRLEPSLAATGGNLMQRVSRLLGQPKEPTGASALVIAVGVVLGVVCLAGMAQEVTGAYKNWLAEDVAYIVSEEEAAAFRALQSDAERERFVEQFWQRRDPKPETAQNEFKQEHYRRIQFANERFWTKRSGWKTDLGRTYIVYGPPDEIEIHHEEKQSWLYRELPGVGSNVILSFTYKDGEYVCDTDPAARRQGKN